MTAKCRLNFDHTIGSFVQINYLSYLKSIVRKCTLSQKHSETLDQLEHPAQSDQKPSLLIKVFGIDHSLVRANNGVANERKKNQFFSKGVLILVIVWKLIINIVCNGNRDMN